MKKFSILFLLIFLTGCTKKPDIPEGIKLDVVEDKIEIQRIISTVPANTEILVGLGLGDRIVAVDSYSDRENLNEDVQIIDMLALNMELILELEPDIIIGSEHNGEGISPFDKIINLGMNVLNISSPKSIDEIYKSIEIIGKGVNKEEEAQEMIKEMKFEIDNIAEKGKKIENRKKVYFEIGSFEGKLYSMGSQTFIDDIITLVGGDNIYREETGWLVASIETIIDKNPDVIITNLSNAGTTIIDIIKNRPAFNETTAVKNDLVYIVNNNRTSRGSQKIVEGIKEIAEAIYPKVYDYEK